MFGSELSAEAAYRANSNNSFKICGLSFNVSGNNISYSIRLGYDSLPKTGDMLNGNPNGRFLHIHFLDKIVLV